MIMTVAKGYQKDWITLCILLIRKPSVSELVAVENIAAMVHR